VPFSYDAAVFENRYPSLVADPPPVPAPDDPRFGPAQGRCEVVLYTERHTGSLATLSAEELARVVAIWRDRASELWSDTRHRFVMPFENRGAAVGTTLSHPHGQIYAFDHVPPFITARTERLAAHRAESAECLTCAVIDQDSDEPERLLASDEDLLVGVPFAPRWPFEVHVRARRHGARRLTDLTPAELLSLEAALHGVIQRYDGLFGFELPYMMVALDAPADAPDWHLAFEFLPPNRSERLLKIRASVETATGLFINDTVPESSAERLRAVAVSVRTEAPVPEVTVSSVAIR
jgi:UDPglucose--hexose-1-phosphate uridylyltransferase